MNLYENFGDKLFRKAFKNKKICFLEGSFRKYKFQTTTINFNLYHFNIGKRYSIEIYINHCFYQYTQTINYKLIFLAIYFNQYFYIYLVFVNLLFNYILKIQIFLIFASCNNNEFESCIFFKNIYSFS
ncbi:hypothetical protein H311_01630 [Anncaliia algerae PRA109]|nr:hypothetical protein H311_01630 [Anncaliia algerae PRA109]